jgi:ribokinase
MAEHRGHDGHIVVAGAHVCGLFFRVDSVPAEGETVLGRDFDEPEDGGKATNQAVAIARLGAPVRLVTLVGDDQRGRRWRELLNSRGVETGYVLEAAGATDVGVVLLPPSRIPAIVSLQGLSAQLDEARVESARAAFDHASVVVCQLEAPWACALASFRLGRAAGAITILNPAPAEEFPPELLDLTDVFVPNEHEAVVFAGGPAAVADLAARLVELHPHMSVVVTAGSDGCYVARHRESVVHVPAPQVDAVDTTGAGDGFVGALAVRLRDGDDLVTAACFAVRAAALSVTRAGTIPAYADAAELSTDAEHCGGSRL